MIYDGATGPLAFQTVLYRRMVFPALEVPQFAAPQVLQSCSFLAGHLSGHDNFAAFQTPAVLCSSKARSSAPVPHLVALEAPPFVVACSCIFPGGRDHIYPREQR